MENQQQNLEVNESEKCGGVTKPETAPEGENPNGYYSCVDEGWVWIENIGEH